MSLTVTGACKRDETDKPIPAAKPAPPAPEIPWPASADDLAPTTSHLLDGMDNNVVLNDAELKGRNAWVLWSADNHLFWDELARNSYGVLDLLKTLSIPRDKRFALTGLINEPGFKKNEKPDPNGLQLDERVTAGTDDPDPRVYGRSSGVVGLRLFDNPAFDEAAKKKWDAARFYKDPLYYNDPGLVRPYTVGMACGLCHVSFNPLHPPNDVSNPKYDNLSANIGAEFFWVSRIFGKDIRADNFVYQLMDSSPPGSLDTSLIASDSINAPRTMNAIFNVGARLGVAKTLAAREKQTGMTLLVPGVKGGVPGVQEGIDADGYMTTTHVLKDGADSVGLAGALSRVFINIGEYHQEWLKHFKPLIGGKQTPMDVESANKNSPYWNATAKNLPNLAAFFLKVAGPMHLEDAPGGKAYLNDPPALVQRGKLVFADECASCHSSKQPPGAPPSPGYFDGAFKAWVKTPAYKTWMQQEAAKDDFRQDNFFSTDMRHSIKEIGTNACASVGTNSIKGHVWDAFSSETYKSLPPVGEIDVVNPITGTRSKWNVPGGGRGYLRPPSLISLWASAPFFINNTLGGLEYATDADGRYIHKPDVASVDARMRVFKRSVEQLLWPEKRDKDPYLNAGKIFRTTAESYLRLSVGALPPFLKDVSVLAGKQEILLGPIPKGTPMNLVANIDVAAGEADSDVSRADLVAAIATLAPKLAEIKLLHLDDKHAAAALLNAVPALLKVNKCPDFEMNRGHLFGTKRSDADKSALIAFLKTL
jgi:mono/diheme cytochrome c family protein